MEELEQHYRQAHHEFSLHGSPLHYECLRPGCGFLLSADWGGSAPLQSVCMQCEKNTTYETWYYAWRAGHTAAPVGKGMDGIAWSL